MADKMAMKLGQRMLKKKLASRQGRKGEQVRQDGQDKQANQPEADKESFLHHYPKDEYGKKQRKKKDVAYYTAKSIPPKDAQILVTVMHRAQRLDSGFKILGLKMGWSSIIGFAVPVGGDFIDVGLSCVLILRKAEQVSGGSDKWMLRTRMVGYVTTGAFIGVIPIVGEFFDTLLRFNTRSAKALEAMLLARVEKPRKLATDPEKADEGMGTAAPVAARNHAAADTSRRAEPVHRTPVGQKSEPARTAPTRDDEQYGDMHKRIATKSTKDPTNKSQKVKSGGSWFGKRGAQSDHMQNGRTGGGRAEVAPVPPPRPAVSGRSDNYF